MIQSSISALSSMIASRCIVAIVWLVATVLNSSVLDNIYLSTKKPPSSCLGAF